MVTGGQRPARIVLVTGAAGGLGSVMVRALLSDGHCVAGVDADEAALRTLADGLGRPPRLHPIACDLAAPDACREAVEDTVAIFGGLHAVINNAVVQNMWTGATVTAVMGDHIEINAIIQINAWCDSDNVTSAIDGWNRAPDANAIFNVATFERKDVADDDDGVDEDGFPQHWVIKKSRAICSS